MRRIALLVVLLPLFCGSPPALGLEACCNIVSIDAVEGVVTAEETATGRTFSFSVRDTALLDALRPGMGFDTRGAPGGTTFSLMNIADVRPDWRDECCNLVGPASISRVDLGQAANGGKDCCNVVSVEQGIVTAREMRSGRTFRFRASDAVLAGLRPGTAFDTRGIPGETAFSVVGIADLGSAALGDCCELVGDPAQVRRRQPAGLEPDHGITATAGIDPDHGSVGAPKQRPGVLAMRELAPGVVLSVLELRRVNDNVLHFAFAIDNETDEAVNPMNYGILGWVGAGPTRQANGIRLHDLVGLKYYRAGTCSQGYDLDVEPQSRREYWAQYKSPPPDVRALTVTFTEAPPIYDVPIE